MVNQIEFNKKPHTMTCIPMGHVLVGGGRRPLEGLSVGDKGCFSAYLLLPVIIGNEIKEQQLSLWKDFMRVWHDQICILERKCWVVERL